MGLLVLTHEPSGLALERLWTINGRFLGQPLSGVQRYAREIVRNLDQLLARADPLTNGLRVELLMPECVENDLSLKVIEGRHYGRMRGHLWEQTQLPAAARGRILSLCNTGPVFARDQIVCIHDLNTRTFPGSYSLPFRIAYRALLPALGRSANSITTVSAYSARELVQFNICDRYKISVIPNGCDHTGTWQPCHSASTRAAASRSTIVVLGSSIPHKNVRMILGLAARLKTVNMTLAIVGAKDPLVFNSEQLDISESNILWLGSLTDNELAALLRDSMCLAFPSFVEGFGLPPLEAMAMTCPVIASDSASIPEVCGDAAVYASPANPDAWFHAFVRIRSDNALRTLMIKRGKNRALNFRWRDSTLKYLALMARVDGVQAADRASQFRHRAA